MEPHPLAAAFRAHLKHFGGSWLKKLPPDLKEAFDECNKIESDVKRAAVLLMFGSPSCEHKKILRISDGWRFCHRNGSCVCYLANQREKTTATNMAKYGCANPAQNPQVKQKMRNTCIERHGVEYSGSIIARQEKAKATNLAKRGVENVFASEEIKEKIRQRNIEVHGVEHVMQNPEIRAKANRTVREKYDVENVMQLPEIKAKVAETNMERYGGIAPASSPIVKAKMKKTMQQNFNGGNNANQHIEPEHWIIDEEDFRNRFEGLRVNNVAEQTGYHPSMLWRYANRWNVIMDTRGGSHRKLENEFADRLRQEAIDFQQNTKILIPEGMTDRRTRQEIDFYVPERALGIEFHGLYWHSDMAGKDKDYHANKLKMATNQGIDLIQIFEDEWMKHPEAVIATIRHRLGMTINKVFARECKIVSVSHAEATMFYNGYHVFGGVSATVHYGLQADERLVACMSFTRRDDQGQWELVRFATQDRVIGGASRLLKAFERSHDWSMIISFADLRWSKGALYQTLGFEHEATLAPDFMYIVNMERVHKFNYRKSSKQFIKYEGQDLTERQMADLEGIPRIYDAGKLRMIRYNPKD